MAQDDTERCGRVRQSRLHTEEVTGSIPVSPTSTGRRPGGIGYAQIQRETERTPASLVAGQRLRRAPIHLSELTGLLMLTQLSQPDGEVVG
ncbi:MAG: hypothetical protein LC808_17900, partial [Actinobacteria bacterium]|nr:hypothetical protein [Actinomycetota bacterium]